MTDTLTKRLRFARGAAVPEWLLVAEPLVANAPRGNFHFAFETDVFEAPEYFSVVPLVMGVQGQPAIDIGGTAHHRFYAPGKPVRLTLRDETFLPLEMNGWTNMSPSTGAPPPSAPPPPLPLVAPPPWSLGQRLRMACRALFG